MSSVTANIQEVIEQVRMSALKANRNPSDIQIVAVTKTVPVERIRQAVDAGMTVLGENRVQELLDKHPEVDGVDWHLIGHLQTNKVKYIADKITLLHSLDSTGLAEELNKRMNAAGRVLDVLVQVNVADESTKFGIKPSDTFDFIDSLRKLTGIKVKGLMTIGPYVSDPEEVRPVFRQLRELAGKVKTMDFPGVEMVHLSMGMSNDYTVAVEEGATLIRLGSIIFGSRN